MVFNTGAALLDAIVLAVVSRDKDGTYGYKTVSYTHLDVYKRQPNIFMVGDVKQSIYKFRQARPELFMEKYEAYTAEDSLHQKIDLHRNFRSREEVLRLSLIHIYYFFGTAFCRAELMASVSAIEVY